MVITITEPWMLWKRSDIQNLSILLLLLFFLIFLKKKERKFCSSISTVEKDEEKEEEDDGWECCHGDRQWAENKAVSKMSA